MQLLPGALAGGRAGGQAPIPNHDRIPIPHRTFRKRYGIGSSRAPSRADSGAHWPSWTVTSCRSGRRDRGRAGTYQGDGRAGFEARRRSTALTGLRGRAGTYQGSGRVGFESRRRSTALPRAHGRTRLEVSGARWRSLTVAGGPARTRVTGGPGSRLDGACDTRGRKGLRSPVIPAYIRELERNQDREPER